MKNISVVSSICALAAGDRWRCKNGKVVGEGGKRKGSLVIGEKMRI